MLAHRPGFQRLTLGRDREADAVQQHPDRGTFLDDIGANEIGD